MAGNLWTTGRIWMTRGFRVSVAVLNAVFLIGFVGLRWLPDNSKTVDVLWFGLFVLQFTVPILSMFALLYYPPETRN
jgi:hypothetical protein